MWNEPRLGWGVGRRRVRRLMRKIGLLPIDQAPGTSEPHPAHKTYPYLLGNFVIGRPNHVWRADATDIPLWRSQELDSSTRPVSVHRRRRGASRVVLSHPVGEAGS